MRPHEIRELEDVVRERNFGNTKALIERKMRILSHVAKGGDLRGVEKLGFYREGE